MDLQTLINEMPYGRIGILGGVGSGKSTAAGILEFPKVRLVIYLDITGAFMDKIPGGFALVRVPALPEDEGRREALFSKIKRVLQTCRHKKILFNLVALMVDKAHLKAFCDKLSDWLMLGDFGDVAIVVDEMPEFCPQSGGDYCTKLETLFRVGRNWRVQFAVATAQQPQDANKRALNTSAIYAVFQLEAPLALDRVQEYLQEERGTFDEKRKKIMDMPVGCYYLIKMRGRRDWWVDGRRA